MIQQSVSLSHNLEYVKAQHFIITRWYLLWLYFYLNKNVTLSLRKWMEEEESSHISSFLNVSENRAWGYEKTSLTYNLLILQVVPRSSINCYRRAVVIKCLQQDEFQVNVKRHRGQNASLFTSNCYCKKKKSCYSLFKTACVFE